MRRPRVRHHTDDEGLAGIKANEAIHVSRGWGLPGVPGEVEYGVHVEVQPFGSPRPGSGGPRDTMRTFGEGAYVEFDAPLDLEIVRYKCGERNTAIIARPLNSPLALVGLTPVYVKVRRHWWEFWRE